MRALMVPRPHAQALPAKPRLYLMTPPVDDAGAFASVLAAVLASADVAAVLLRLKTAAESELVARIQRLAPVVQGAGAALVLDGHAGLVGCSGADGAHLTGIHAFQAAVRRLKPAHIAGAGGLTTRHDAMLAAEGDADYVMFGEPDLRGERPRLGAIEERVAWWAEVFQPPCVAFAAALDEVGPLAQAGADFVAVGDCLWSDPRGPAAALADAAGRLATIEEVG
ncbi:MAG TPA: thiamine phosphate synthase [Xanthobacteraceae bacterium]|nr:thiamine phosphate synthase [Xanthobacteraceae bacterium]